MRIGVISDTHNHLDPQVAKLLAGVEHILHAGDIGQPGLLLELENIAPVTAVAGNTDDHHFRYPLTQVIELGEHRFLLHHIVNPHALTEGLQRQIQEHRPDVIIFGHTHKRFQQELDGVLFFNPGYAGKPRFGMERSVAIFELEGRRLKIQYLPL